MDNRRALAYSLIVAALVRMKRMWERAQNEILLQSPIPPKDTCPNILMNSTEYMKQITFLEHSQKIFDEEEYHRKMFELIFVFIVISFFALAVIRDMIAELFEVPRAPRAIRIRRIPRIPIVMNPEAPIDPRAPRVRRIPNQPYIWDVS
uniref:Anoctamin n=1 Tax=Caenorhabditis tropicalis TaxID=1561998 RepID=A0A1I7UPV6_9PELO